MSASNAKKAAPECDAGDDLQDKTPGQRASTNTASSPRRERTTMDRALWFSDARAIAFRGRSAFDALDRSAQLGDLGGFGDATESVFGTTNELAGLIDTALDYEASRGPTDEMRAAAAAEYRAERGDRVTTATQRETSTQRRSPPTVREPSPKVIAERERLRLAHPAQFTAGMASEMARKGAPPEFDDWSASERDAFFAGAMIVVEDRHRERAGENADR